MNNCLKSGFYIIKEVDEYQVYRLVPQELLYSSALFHQCIDYAVASLGDSGGDIALGPGQFILEKPISLASHIWLKGSGRGTVLHVGKSNHIGIGILCENLVGVEISNLVLSGRANPQASAGIVLDGCGNCKVMDLLSVGFSGYGLWIRNETMLSEVRGCSFGANQKANIFFDRHRRGKFGDFIPNLVSNCIIFGGGKGIDCLETTVLNIVACVIYQTKDIAIHIRDVSYSVLVTGCRTFQISAPAVLVENTGEINLSSNIFCWHTGDGIIVKNCGWGLITGNEIIDSGSYNPGVKDFTSKIIDVPSNIPLCNGISLFNSRGVNLTGNTIFNWPQARKLHVGIFEDENCHKNAITNNNINYFYEAAIVSKGSDTTVLVNTFDAEHPYDGNPQEVYHQSFQPNLTEMFIDMLI